MVEYFEWVEWALDQGVELRVEFDLRTFDLALCGSKFAERAFAFSFVRTLRIAIVAAVTRAED
jgi:hypothetical protein